MSGEYSKIREYLELLEELMPSHDDLGSALLYQSFESAYIAQTDKSLTDSERAIKFMAARCGANIVRSRLKTMHGREVSIK